MTKKALYTILILAIIASACAAAPKATVVAPEYDRSFLPAQPATAGEAVPAEPGSVGGNYVSNVPEARRLVLKNASISIAVDSPSTSMERISKLAENMGGYVVSSQIYTTRLDSGAEVQQASVSIRVPAERLDEALAEIKKETSLPVVKQNLDSQDVTKEYTDLESRLKNLEVAEKQLQTIMEQAADTDKVLDVYNQLMQVREQIEVIKGQMQYYEQSAALSLIQVELLVNAAVQPLNIGGWQPKGVANSAIRALLSTLRFLFYAGIWIVIYVIPVLVVIALPFTALFFIIRTLRRRAKRLKAASAPPKEKA